MDQTRDGASLTHRLSAGLAVRFERTGADEVFEIAERCFDLRVTAVTRLATERDDTFRLAVDGDPHGFVLKIAPPHENAADDRYGDLPDDLHDDPGEFALPFAAIEHASRRDAALPLQRPVPSIIDRPRSTGRSVTLTRYLPGRLLAEVGASSTELRLIGRMLARLTVALDDFAHPAADRWLAWDLTHLDELSELLPFVHGGDRQRVAAAVLAELADETLPALRATPRQVVHNDFHGENLVVDQSSADFITGILDFGDVVMSHRAADLAIAMSYAGGYARRCDHPWQPALAVAAGYDETTKLSPQECAILPTLVLGRIVQRLLLGSWLATTRPENAAYTARNLARSGDQLLALWETRSASALRLPIQSAGGLVDK